MGRTVAVIGGGYGGSAAAKAMDRDADIVLIDPRDAFVHSAGSLRALVQPDWAGNIFYPYDTLLERGTVLRDRAVSVSPGGVTLASGRGVDADYIVLASGSGYPYPAKPDVESSAEALERLRRTHKELAGADRVLIAGAGPVGLELAGEIKAVWPGKRVTIVDPASELLPGFDPEMREDLRRQLKALDIDVRLNTAFASQPPTGPGVLAPFTVETASGEIGADIWFRCYGTRINADYLGTSLAGARTPEGRVKVTDRLNIVGHDHIYALGDITDIPEAKMAGYAMQHAEVVARNIIAQVKGEEPTAEYRPSPVPAILLPLGPLGGVGQFPSPDGPAVLPAEKVSEYKGNDLMTGIFAELFGAS